MAINHRDVEGSISVIDFSITLGSASISSDKQKVVISYTGYAYPEKTDVEVTTYQYSLDNGVTWATMTPSGGTVITGLTFSEAGTAHTFEWEAKTDQGMEFYNTSVRIRLRGTSGVDLTSLAYGNYTFPRIVQSLSTASEASPFPSSYGGVAGSDLLQMAPKLV